MRTVEAQADHNAYLEALKQAFADHGHMNVQDLLAVTSQFVGMLVAHQDCRIPGAQIMAMVADNITHGNEAALMAAPVAGQC